MPARKVTVRRIAELVGDGFVLDAEEDGWPARARIRIPSSNTPIRLSLHTSTVGTMSRAVGEMRFQNPGQNRPMVKLRATLPLLIGLADGRQPVLVGADPRQRLGRTTRFSVRFPDALLDEARARGWAEYVSTSGEVITAFHPSLFPVFVEASTHALDLAPGRVADVVAGSGLLEDDDDASRTRMRRATTALVRDARFSRAVKQAYEERCGMCGLDLGLVSAAHIYPAHAPGSHDSVWNGVLLCDNHHRAFDAHLISVNPGSRQISFRPSVQEQAAVDPIVANFVNSTFAALRVPGSTSLQPRPRMFTRRYEYFGPEYVWAVA